MILPVLTVLLAVLVSGAVLHCVLAVIASAAYRRRRPEPSRDMPFLSVLKPLAGDEEGLREDLRCIFEQEYPEFEVLLSVADGADPALAVGREVSSKYPETHSKVAAGNLRAMAAEARYDVLVMIDRDVRARPDLLRVIASEMANLSVQAVTCPYRASAGLSLWSALEAVGLNTDFLSRVLVAQMRGSMDFAIGAALAIRREALDATGGFGEDFEIDFRVGKLRGRVLLSSFIVERVLGAQPFRANIAHRFRSARVRRRARPRRYPAEIFGNPILLAALLLLVAPACWPLFALGVIARFWVAYATAEKVLHDPLTRDLWYLIPVQDVLSFVVWVGGFLG